MQAKLDAAKESLLTMMTRSCWRKEWRDQVIKWSGQVVIESGGRWEYVRFPAEAHPQYDRGIFLKYDSVTLLPVASNRKEYKVGDAIHYRNFSSDDYGLTAVPINLAVDVYRHFAIALGITFSKEDDHTSHCYQYLRIDEKDERRHKMIHSILRKFPSGNNESNALCDGWERLWIKKIQLGGKLLPIHYIEEVLQPLRVYQMGKMIEYHLGEQGKEVITTAKCFVQFLTCKNAKDVRDVKYETVDTGGVNFVVHAHDLPINLVTASNSNNSDKVVSANRIQQELAKTWDAAMREEIFVEYLGKLTILDVEFLVRLFIDAHHDYQDSLSKITQPITTASETSPTSVSAIVPRFPTAADDFSSFDPPHLRGTLAETVLSKKLSTYALGKEEILSGDFAAIAPSALVHIVVDYYPIDIN